MSGTFFYIQSAQAQPINEIPFIGVYSTRSYNDAAKIIYTFDDYETLEHMLPSSLKNELLEAYTLQKLGGLWTNTPAKSSYLWTQHTIKVHVVLYKYKENIETGEPYERYNISFHQALHKYLGQKDNGNYLMGIFDTLNILIPQPTNHASIPENKLELVNVNMHPEDGETAPLRPSPDNASFVISNTNRPMASGWIVGVAKNQFTYTRPTIFITFAIICNEKLYDLLTRRPRQASLSDYINDISKFQEQYKEDRGSFNILQRVINLLEQLLNPLQIITYKMNKLVNALNGLTKKINFITKT